MNIMLEVLLKTRVKYLAIGIILLFFIFLFLSGMDHRVEEEQLGIIQYRKNVLSRVSWLQISIFRFLVRKINTDLFHCRRQNSSETSEVNYKRKNKVHQISKYNSFPERNWPTKLTMNTNHFKSIGLK